MTDAKLKSYVDRVKALIAQQKEIGADITQVCKDAKDDDFEPAMIRFAARELLMDSAKRNARDDKRHHYLHAVGLAVDMVSNGDVSLREAAKACGVSKSSIHRALSVPAVSQPKAIKPCWALANDIVAMEIEAAKQAEAERKRKRDERIARMRELFAPVEMPPLPPFLDRRAQA